MIICLLLYTKIWMALHKKCIDVQNYPKCTSFWNGQLYFQNVYDLFFTFTNLTLNKAFFAIYIFISPDQRPCELFPWLDVRRMSSNFLHILIFCLKLLNQIEPNLAGMVLGKRKFRLAQMKLIFPGEGLLRDPKSSQEAPIEMVHSFESPLISRSNKLKLYLFCLLIVCTSHILCEGHMFQYMKCQNIWISTLVKYTEWLGSIIFGKNTTCNRTQNYLILLMHTSNPFGCSHYNLHNIHVIIAVTLINAISKYAIFE